MDKHLILKILILALTMLSAGWMIFDGSRALIKGDYVRPKSGAYAGQLGPWSKIVRAVGVDPESNGMRWAFVIFGLLWVASAVTFALNGKPGWPMMMLFSVGSLWYLVIGTIVGALIAVLLLLYRFT